MPCLEVVGYESLAKSCAPLSFRFFWNVMSLVELIFNRLSIFSDVIAAVMHHYTLVNFCLNTFENGVSQYYLHSDNLLALSHSVGFGLDTNSYSNSKWHTLP